MNQTRKTQTVIIPECFFYSDKKLHFFFVRHFFIYSKVFVCALALTIFFRSFAAENRVRGVVLFEMHAGIAEFGRRQGPDALRGLLIVSYLRGNYWIECLQKKKKKTIMFFHRNLRRSWRSRTSYCVTNRKSFRRAK